MIVALLVWLAAITLVTAPFALTRPRAPKPAPRAPRKRRIRECGDTRTEWLPVNREARQ